ncbi:MAG: 4Fe-4S ferredoxin [Methanolobus sp. T82-4]|nr:MAG: 4Fe-4S ferredoxin [Methanolobus sp. T82-4]
MKSTIESIVNNNLCIGCGICAGVCPQQLLNMDFDIYGKYIPSLRISCSKECGLCMKVCPFNDENENETEIGKKLFGYTENIQHSEETGYYLNSFVGYSSEFRETSASGGLATWLLTTLIAKDIVDYVICVTPHDNPEKLFTFQIFENVESIAHSAGSAYYPVELSDIIQQILDKPGRYAITGLPCFLKAIRLATSQNKKLKKRIVYTIGLVCGQSKSKYYTAYITKLTHIKGKPQKVTYRGKSPDRPANNFYFCCQNEHGEEGKVFWSEGVSEAWTNRWFTPNSCNFCDDVFAELADVVFMDAWLPKYSKDSKGTSLMLVRSTQILNIVLETMNNKQINITTIPIDELIQSQAGVIEVKRKQLSYRLYIANQSGQIVPDKRVKSSKKIDFLTKKHIELKLKMQEKSKQLLFQENQTLTIKDIKAEMHPFIKKKRLLDLVEKSILSYKKLKNK